MEYDVYDYVGDVAAEPEMALRVNRELSLARKIVEQTGNSLFLTGKAGTGKTTFLRRLREESAKQMVVLAPTGVAAINAEGVTIHSFFQLAFTPYIPGKGYIGETSKKFSLSRQKRHLMSMIDLLVIDEISMVRPDTMDAIDETLRRVRGNDSPFGGVQLLMIGDVRQLAPVVKDIEWTELGKYYASPYFFESRALKKSGFLTIELQTIYRQSDKNFIDILNAVRDGKVDRGLLQRLNSRYNPTFDPEDREGYIHLTTHNATATDINRRKLDAIASDPVEFGAIVKGEFPETSYPAESRLVLKTGAQVMFIKNDQGEERRYYNGMIGRVAYIGENSVTVMPDGGGTPIEIGYAEWENTKYSLDDESGEITTRIVGKFFQIPLRLAWAITIHKSQGLTFERAIIDAGRSFAPGQTYVALSRCRSVEGLVLNTPITAEAVIVDSHVNEFVSSYANYKPDGNTLTSLQGEYTGKILREMFDFTTEWRRMEDFRRVMLDDVIPVYENLSGRLEEEYMRMMIRVVNVATKFVSLYCNGESLEEGLPEFLKEKIRGGCRYFSEELGKILDFLPETEVELDNMKYAKRLANSREELRFRLEVKKSLFDALSKKDFSLTDYSMAKSKGAVTADRGRGAGKIRKVRMHKDSATESAKDTRVSEAKECDEAPGKAADTSERKRKRGTKATSGKDKPPKGYSKYISLNLYREGKRIPEIASERNLAETTIEGHLAYFIANGTLMGEEFIPASHLEILEREFGMGLTYSEVAEKLAGTVTEREISFYYRIEKEKRSASAESISTGE